MRAWEVAPDQYQALLQEKCAQVEELLQDFNPPPATVIESPRESYRIRAEFRVWHDGDDLAYVMFDPSSPRVPVPIRDFPPAIAPIRQLMTPLREYLQGNIELRRKLFQAEFMASQDGELLVTLIYHRPLNETWEQEAKELAEHFEVHVIGRSRKQKVVLSQDYITDTFTVNERSYRYRQYEQSFVQPNGPVNEQMLAWAVEQSRDADGDLLELYCGNGNFTLPLAANFGTVIATELSKSGIRAAGENLKANGIDNVHVIRLSAEEVSEAMAGAREFRRLATLPKPLADYQLTTALVDPPRAGLDPNTLACVQQLPRILYISCNPETLANNLSQLMQTHHVTALAFFDQFPYTHHLECGIHLRAR